MRNRPETIVIIIYSTNIFNNRSDKAITGGMIFVFSLTTPVKHSY
jgi:hypothetical protein